MSIELNSAPKSAKTLASADPHGKKAGKAPDGSGGSGFSALMNSLSASEDTAASLVAATSLADAPPTEKDKLCVDVDAAGSAAILLMPPYVASESTPTLAIATATSSASVPDAITAAALTPVIGGVVPQVPLTLAPTLTLDVPKAALMSVQAAGASLGVAVAAGLDANANDVPPMLDDLALPQTTGDSVNLLVKDGKEIRLPVESNSVPNKPGQHVTTADTGALQKAALANTASDALSASGAGGRSMAEAAQTSTVSAMLAHKSAAQAQAIGAAQQDFKEAKTAAASQSVVPASDTSTTLLAGVASDFVRPQGRFGARPGFGQSGSSGFEGAFGQAMAGTNRSDAVFEVPPASAAVADTAVAETVSYWASQGVQTAELTLDGFGDSPVEVSILLNGDQAQIDFRTDQEGVRQVLEAATAQLKELLSSQGLALAGVSVGTSGKGNDTGGERRSRSDAKQVTMVKSDALGPVATRAANPAVGRSLDLFV